MEGTRQRISLLTAAAAFVLSLAPLPVQAYPVVTTEYFSGLSRESKYRDGFQVNGAGTAYTHYTVGSGAFQPLTQDLAATKTLLGGGNVKLWGYDGNNWVEYPNANNGNDLTPHTAHYGWDYGYTLAFDGEDVTVDVQIDFDWSNTALTAQQQAARMATWEKNIEGWWNDQYKVSKDWGEYIFDLVIDVTFEGYPTGVPGEPPLFNQEVEVHPGTGRADMENWFLGDNAQTNAHEFGHMLGLFDEYWAGGIDTSLKDPLDDDHLMGADPTSLAFGDGMKQSYYDFVLPWMAAIDPDDSQVYGLIPEPATGLILLTGLVGMALVRRRNSDAH